ncbi:MAG: PD-(D/E)XK nuclease family protein [Bacteroidota bacterium]
MKSFLEQVIEQIHKAHKDFDDAVFVLPSKRAGIFLKQYLTSFIDRPIFSPKIYSIEELIIEISGLETAPNLNLLLGLYDAFRPHSENEAESFDSFILWGNTLLSDFNEIDRNLIDATALFDYLTANQRIKNWGTDKRATPLISNTIKFWGKLNTVYTSFRSDLLSKGIGYQGLLYREAVSKVEHFLKHSTSKKFYLVGFNALNKAEEHIFQTFMEHGKSTVWWDIDPYFLKDNIHEAGFFIRDHLKKWPQAKVVSSIGSSYVKEKTIAITGVPKSISQAKFAGTILKNLINQKNGQNIALVLSDETLLRPILNSLPDEVKKVNITMGLPLRKTTLFDFFSSLFDLHIKKSKNGWFYKDVIRVFSNPYCILLFQTSGENIATKLNTHIKEKNIRFVNYKLLEKSSFSKSNLLKDIFGADHLSAKACVKVCLHLVQELKNISQASPPQGFYELYGFFQLFNQLDSILDSQPFLNSLKTLKFLFNELVSLEKIDFKGEPLGGLQIMGVLESRNLDFETVILTSVNEGILPAGKTQNSFIPYDIKKEFGLPTYKEKDAIYAYHFYRLIQRAKKVHIIYNTEPDVLLGNEKSRFISQLVTDSAITGNVIHTIAAPEIKMSVAQPKEIIKTPELIRQLQKLSGKGFSPTSLTNYIKNPYAFYKSNILGLKEVDDVEESIAHHTFGTIVHDSLEELYLPLMGQTLSPDNLEPLKKRVGFITKMNFEKYFLPRDVESGQNLIAFHVIQKYLLSFIDFDISRTMSNEITVLSLEEDLKAQISIPNHPHPIFLKGKLDRLEQFNGSLQILDYKTGNTSLPEVELMHLEECLTNERRAKAFQLLCYAFMVHKERGSSDLLAGIVPIKKISSGVLLFAQKSGTRGPKNHSMDRKLLIDFENHLIGLILEILNPNIPFVEKQ